MPKSTEVNLDHLPFPKSAVVGMRGGIPVIKTKELIKLGIQVPKKTTKKNLAVKKKPTTAKVESTKKKLSDYEKFNVAYQRFKAGHKSLSIDGQDKKEAWESAKIRINSEGDDKLKPTLGSFGTFFNELWLQ